MRSDMDDYGQPINQQYDPETDTWVPAVPLPYPGRQVFLWRRLALLCVAVALLAWLFAGCTGYYAPNGAGFHRTQAQRDSAARADSLEFWRADSIYQARRDSARADTTGAR